MKKIFTGVSFMLALFCSALGISAQNLCSQLDSSLEQLKQEKFTEQTFSPKEGRFKINLPPVNAAKPADTDQQKTLPQQTRYMWMALNRGRFVVTYYDTNKKLDDPSVSKTILDNFRNSLMSKGAGELQTDKDLLLKSFPGREVKIKDEKGINISRAYLVGSRFYIVSVFIPIKLECAVNESTKTLDSFELVDQS
jgi:hypothetical protein